MVFFNKEQNQQSDGDFNGTQQANGRFFDNSQFINANAIQIRIDTTPIITQFENFLRGRVEIPKIDRVTGQTYYEVTEGKPLMNEDGIQWILGQFMMLANSQVVQGNFDADEYQNYLCSRHKNIALSLEMNRYNFDIKEVKGGSIIDMFMFYTWAFISRLKDNKERESYAQSIRSSEVLSQKNDGGFLSKFPIIGR